MRKLKIGLALAASSVGVFLPYRARVLYSELLGWVAQLVPPSLYQVPDDEGAQRD